MLTQQASAYMRAPYTFPSVSMEDKSLPQPEVEVMTSAMSGPSEQVMVPSVSSLVTKNAGHDQGHGRDKCTLCYAAKSTFSAAGRRKGEPCHRHPSSGLRGQSAVAKLTDHPRLTNCPLLTKFPKPKT